MLEHLLGNRRVLVVEDEYFLARDLDRDLTAAGATIVGPVSSLAEATAAVDAGSPLDCAVLDVNLGGEMVFPLADTLAARGVPFVLLTGYDLPALPPRYAGRTICEKPVDHALLTAAIGRAIAEAVRAPNQERLA